jgi:hypothetical protein
MCRLRFALCFVPALLLILGCGGGKPTAAQTAGVKGTVNIDNKPVPTGEIHFGVTGTPPKVLEIKDGNFSGDAPIGKNQVEVFIYTEGPASEKYGGTRSKINTVPQKYWGANTTLSATVNAGASNEFKFDITSK